MKNGILYSIALSTVLLSACEPIGEEGDFGGSTPFDQARYNDYVDARNDANTVFEDPDMGGTLGAAPLDNTAQLQGAYGINTIAANGPSLVGEMTMNVDFGNETISGSLTNNFLDPDGVDESEVIEVDGSVNFSGNLDLDPSGGFYDSTNEDKWQFESATTGTLVDNVSSTSEAINYRLDIDINGNFYDASGIGDVDGVGEVGDVAAAGLIEGNIDVTTAGDTTLYDIKAGSGFLVYELENE